MKFTGESHLPRTDSPLQKLPQTAESLNSASARLNDAVDKLNSALKKLNLGVPAWIDISSSEEGPFSEVEQIGYDKVDGKWGISLRKIFEDQNKPDGEEEVTAWHFADAPREMRIRAVKYFNELVEKLNSDAELTAQKIIERATDAEELAAQISAAAEISASNRASQKKGGK